MKKTALFLMLLYIAPITPTMLYGEPTDLQEIEKLEEEIENKKNKYLNQQTQTAVNTDFEYRKLQEQNKVILLIVISIATPILLFLVLFYIKENKQHTARNIVNATGLVLVIQATIFVVLASATTDQLTGSIGVLGAIAGYLFGSATKKDSDEKTKG